jgi:hypothetical protein
MAIKKDFMDKLPKDVEGILTEGLLDEKAPAELMLEAELGEHLHSKDVSVAGRIRRLAKSMIGISRKP